MRILLVSISDYKGGASRLAYTLAAELIENGHQVEMLVSSASTKEEFVKEIKVLKSQKISKLKYKIINHLGINALNLLGSFPKNIGKEYYKKFDLIHIHDLPNNFNYTHLPWLTNIRPVVWTIHSMQPLTGNCLYSYDCDRWTRSCGKCPQYGTWPLQWQKRDGSRINMIIKKEVAKKCKNLNLIGVSEWISKKARSSLWGAFPVKTILNTVDYSIFSKKDKNNCRKKIGIPLSKKVILFSIASNSQDTRKGIDIILDAIPKIKTKDILFIPLGISNSNSDITKKIQKMGFDSLENKHIDNLDELCLYYNSVDLIWHPSKADTSSLCILESSACGTPAIASKVGGVKEIIEHQKNGIFINPNSSEDLATETDKFFSNEELRKKLSAGALVTQKKFSKHQFLEGHIELYKKILS